MSTVPEIQDAIADLIDTATTVSIDVGYPGYVESEHIWVTGTSDFVWSDEESGYGSHDETGDVSVLVLVTKMNSEYTVPRDRAFAIAALVTAAIASDRTLSGLVQRAWVSKVASQESLVDSERSVGVTVTVSSVRTVTG